MRESVMATQLESGKATITRLTSELKRLEVFILAFYQAKKDFTTSASPSITAFRVAEVAFFTLAEEILVRKMGRAVAPEHVTLDVTTIGHAAPRRPRRRRAEVAPGPNGGLTLREVVPGLEISSAPRPRRSRVNRRPPSPIRSAAGRAPMPDMGVGAIPPATMYIDSAGHLHTYPPIEPVGNHEERGSRDDIPVVDMGLTSTPVVVHPRRRAPRTPNVPNLVAHMTRVSNELARNARPMPDMVLTSAPIVAHPRQVNARLRIDPPMTVADAQAWGEELTAAMRQQVGPSDELALAVPTRPARRRRVRVP